MAEAVRIFTVGHGSRGIDELVAILSEAGVRRLLDVRRFPTSRRNPHLSRESLGPALSGHGIAYAWRGDGLGGRREGKEPMCAETLWWKCHRRLIADALAVDGFQVVHLLGNGKTQVHALHPALRLDEDGRPVYDRGETPDLFR
jgi:uncharacterized protein (DUF488 family)